MSACAGSTPAINQIREIAELLAAAFMRLRARKSSAFFGPDGESSLHCSPGQSSDPPVLRKRERA
jgi:hypothetical protein